LTKAGGQVRDSSGRRAAGQDSKLRGSVPAARGLCRRGRISPRGRLVSAGIASNSNLEFEFRRAITEILRMDKAAKQQEWESKQ
jgi:hypothetical protein